MLNRADRLFLQYLQWVSRHPLAVLIASLAVTFGLAGGLSRLEVYVDLDANLPARHPYVEADKQVRSLFGGRYMTPVGVVPRSGTVWSPRALGLLVDLTREAESLPHVIEGNVFSIASAKDIRGTAEGFEVLPILESAPSTDAGGTAVREAFSVTAATSDPSWRKTVGRRSCSSISRRAPAMRRSTGSPATS